GASLSDAPSCALPSKAAKARAAAAIAVRPSLIRSISIGHDRIEQDGIITPVAVQILEQVAKSGAGLQHGAGQAEDEILGGERAVDRRRAHIPADVAADRALHAQIL